MDYEAIRELISQAANSWDGHATNGSVAAIMRIVVKEYQDFVLEKAYLIARGGDDRFKKHGTNQMYWKGRADAASAIRAAKSK